MGGNVQVNKPHKARFNAKSTRQLHKTSCANKQRIAKPSRNATKGGRAARIQQSKMVRDQKRAALLKEKRASSGSAGPPRIIVLFGLSASVNVKVLANELRALLSPEGAEATCATIASAEYKIRTTILEAPHGDLLACMEMAKVADLIAFVASAKSLQEEGDSSSFIDSFGTQCLSVFKALGLPSTAVFIRDLPLNTRKKNDLKKFCISSLASEFLGDSKFYPTDTEEELHKFLYLFKDQHMIVPHWRSHQRAFLMAEEVAVIANDLGKCTLLLSGYLRSHNLSVNQLVHVSGAGDYQLCKIDVLKDPYPLHARKGQEFMVTDELHEQVVRYLVPNPLKQEPLLIENVPDPLAGEQTWPTEAEMAKAEELYKQKKIKKKTLPRGTSDYQAAWIVEDTDEGYSDGDDDGMLLDGEEKGPIQDGMDYSDLDEDQTSLNLRGSDIETEDDTMSEGEILTKEQIEDDIRKIKAAHAEDEEYPDEVDTPFEEPARKRFAKYRGLKSFRTSSWDSKESLPPEYARIFAFDNFMRTQKLVLKKTLEMEHGSTDECVAAGSYVRLHIMDVEVEVASRLCVLAKKSPVIACGLLQHESKMSVLHFSVKKHDTYDAPIKAKEALVFHVGFRQFVARPIFSSANINSDKHKLERFLHAGCFSVASVYAPISFPSLPLIVLKSGQGQEASPAIAAVGSLRSIDPDRIILKKIILTGYPQRVSKLKAAVRYMFHTPEDVRWFKPVEVWTKGGRRGRVKEPVGIHGAMKCIFNGVVQQRDTVCMSLFKRVYPKWPEQRPPILYA
ncbi:hypothetical protein GIB67_022446 [Kingdonia uniflora]|uniref:Bms1-type G domain-containing protein n=1 Tax=Kingdonia uniflora TaxID=39325 RepID=A0A7J7MU01_9MAGN|nr:hypothetical protein GIB67_022446 [Kingdonia uniflora]